ncbi:hypothetical protein GCM10007897_41790 [Sphingobium jiangsuense]|uniref:Putative salt-induced outer membrane protein n=1 Tax=Sphingobium jiangsuense TaxID=870476 RepID=A0A7W6BD08_9SPHN|nr:DUF481 domain-containing protein [Sphingobium jiangsuense]MBB3924635.1 putative salt-induced outer membrane protein [Sphingobium jiangsuense]GLT02756.1 hypothetical protein GCM10007897_41790 [Sphingobium jiangsuense]
MTGRFLPPVGLALGLAMAASALPAAASLQEPIYPPASTPPAIVPTIPPAEPERERERDKALPLPEAVRRMVIEALESGNSADIATIARYAIRANPDAAEEIQAMVNRHQAHAEEERREEIKHAGMFDLWDGKIELGGFRSTGSTSEFGISTSMGATRKGLKWTHALTANADYREANGETSVERILASYSPTYNFDPRNFAYALIQYERDPIVGFDYRYTGSLGIGYTLISNDKVKLSTTLGPSLRETAYTDDGREAKFGARSSLNFRWAFAPTLSLQQTASAYAESDTASVTALTALDARIVSKLSARLSYNMRYESGSKLTDRAFDTTSKMTLIYDF